MDEFARRGNMTGDELLQALQQVGVAESSFREFVRAGIVWRAMVRGIYGAQISVEEDDMERARAALSGDANVQVLLSEIILPAPPERAAEVQALADHIAGIKSIEEFSEQARLYSAAPSRARGGQLNWTPLTNLPPVLRATILGLAPGDVSDPLPTGGAITLFQLRDISEGKTAGAVEYATIDYATYAIPGGRSPKALARATKIKNRISTCEDLYDIAFKDSPDMLVRETQPPSNMPKDIAFELARLDPGEVSTNLTRDKGQTLVFLMMCGRVTKIAGGEELSEQALANFIQSQRLDSFGRGYLEQLRAEAQITELDK